MSRKMRQILCCALLIIPTFLAAEHSINNGAHRERQTFRLQLYDLDHHQEAEQGRMGKRRQHPAVLQRRNSFARPRRKNPTEDYDGLLLADAGFESREGQLTFDLDEEPPEEYGDDYELLRKQFIKEQKATKKKLESGNPGRGDQKCHGFFCKISRKFSFLLIIVSLMILFWCYSGLICFYLPCGWISRPKIHRKIRDYLDRNRPGLVMDMQGNVIGRYEPTLEEVAIYKELQEDLQDL